MAASCRVSLLLLKKRLLLMQLLRLKKLKNKRIKRRWWVHPIWLNRKKEGYFHTLLQKMRTHDHAYFKNFTRMSPTQFDDLLGLLKRKIQKFPLSREPLSPAHRLAITLRFLATGDSLISIAYGFRIGKTTAYKVICETCDALWDVLQPLYLKAPTQETWKEAANEYGRQWQYPNCCGAVDGKHVTIQQPANSGSVYYNYKGTNSIVLMAVVDADYKFLAVDIGGFGSHSDGGIFKASPIGAALQKRRLNLPPPAKLPRTNNIAPYVFVGDEAFQLQDNFLRPYSSKELDSRSRVFNYRLSRARRCSENAFGILGARWRIFHKTITLSPDNVDRIIKATVVLHNFLITKEKHLRKSQKTYCPNGYADFTDSQGYYRYGMWNDEPENGFLALRGTMARNSTEKAKQCRNLYRDYFWSEEGAVPWQWDMPGVNR